MNWTDASQDEKLKEELLTGETIYDGHVVHLEKWEARLPNGKTAGREIIRHVGAAAIAAVDDLGRVLLVRQFRAPLGELIWEVPAGKMDSRGEATLTAAQRELEEETGYRARDWALLTDMVTTPGFCDEHIGVYLARGLMKTHTHPDDDEFLISAWVPLDEAVSAIHSGLIRDSKTIVALLMARDALNK